jgi:hypothetical protein
VTSVGLVVCLDVKLDVSNGDVYMLCGVVSASVAI